MKKIIKNIITCLSLSFCSLAFSKDITVLRLAPAGGALGNWSNAITETLKSSGYNVKFKAFTNCREGSNYVKSNPKESIIFASLNDWVLMDMLDNKNKRSCGFDINKDNLVGIQGTYWNFLCGRKNVNADVESLTSGKEWKIGTTNLPFFNIVTEKQLNYISPNSKIVRILSGRDLTQAFTAGDIDYIVLSSEILANNLNGHKCFLSDSTKEIKDKYFPQRTSFEELGEVPFIGYGVWNIIIGYNLNVDEINKALDDNASEFLSLLRNSFVPFKGNIEQQYQYLIDIKTQLSQLDK